MWIRTEWAQWRSLRTTKVTGTCATSISLATLPVARYSYAVAASADAPDSGRDPDPAAVSRPVVVDVVPRSFTATLHPYADLAQTPALTVTAGPESAHRRIRVQTLRNGEWTEIATVQLNAQGRASVAIDTGRGTAGRVWVRTLLQVGARTIRTTDLPLDRVSSVEPVPGVSRADLGSR